MGMSSQRLPEGWLAGTSSSLAKLHIGARHAVQTIRVCYAAGAMILQITLDIWYMSVCPWAIVAVVTAGIQKHGDYQFIALYTLHTMTDHPVKIKEKAQAYLLILLRLSA